MEVAAPQLRPDLSRLRRAGWLAAMMALAVAALFGVAVAVSLRDAAEYQDERARLVVTLAEESITRSLESAEAILLAIGAMAQKVNDERDWPRLRDTIEPALRFAPHIRQVVVTDRSGRVLIDSTGRVTGRTIDLDRLEVTFQGGHDGEPTHLSALFLGVEIPGRFLPLRDGGADPSPRTIVPAVVTVGRDLLVIGALNPSHLQGLLSQADLGPSGAVRLTRLDGTAILVAESASRSILSGREIPLREVVEQGLQSGMFPLAGGGREGMAAFRLSSRYPVALVAVVSRQDGVEGWLRSSGTLLFWGSVSLAGLLVGGGLLLREMLRRVGLEDQVRLLGLTRTVFAHSSEAMLIVGPGDRILAANPTFITLTGHEAAQVSGRGLDEFVTPDAMGLAGADPGHWRLRCRSGEVREVRMARAPLTGDTAIVTLNDITDRIANERRLRDALHQAEMASRAKSEFLAAMSHELRTPLNAILGFSEMIGDDPNGMITLEMCRDYVNDIHSSGVHLRDIINDLLDLARIEAGKFNLSPEVVDAGVEIALCARLVRERAANHRLTLDIRPCESPVRLCVDRRALRQMLFNLLSNAIKFTPPGGRVVVSCRGEPEGGFRIDVSDTGIGIAPELHDLVFHAYERAPNVEIRRIEGSGLGLALVRAMMEQHGGTVTLISEPGRGSTFSLLFPPDSVRVSAAVSVA